MQAWDRYAYVNNNPLRFVDPTGHSCEEIPEGSYARQQCERSEQSKPPQPPQQLRVLPEDRLDNNGREKLLASEERQPLCFAAHPNCLPFLDRTWTTEEIARLLALLKEYRDYTTGGAILAEGIALLASALGQVHVALGSGLLGGELGWEAYNADTLIDYLANAQEVASTTGEVRISFYRYESELSGIPVIVYYEGADTAFIITSPGLHFTFDLHNP